MLLNIFVLLININLLLCAQIKNFHKQKNIHCYVIPYAKKNIYPCKTKVLKKNNYLSIKNGKSKKYGCNELFRQKGDELDEYKDNKIDDEKNDNKTNDKRNDEKNDNKTKDKMKDEKNNNETNDKRNNEKNNNETNDKMNDEKNDNKTNDKMKDEKNNNETNDKINDDIYETFDEYFNKRAEENYTKLEGEKLKILKENIHTNKDEIRNVLKKTYKNEYNKLIKEDQEDEEVSQAVYENIKITFLMKENINNFLFTQYSYMINKLKEKSVIIKNLKKFYNQNVNPGGDSVHQNEDATKTNNVTDKDNRTHIDDSNQNNNINYHEDIHNKNYINNHEETVLKDQLNNIRKPFYHNKFVDKYYPNNNSKYKEENKSKDHIKNIIENVSFFKPEQNYEQTKNCRTFSDQIFANVKIEGEHILNNLRKGNEQDKNNNNNNNNKFTQDDIMTNDNEGEESTSLFLKNNVCPLQLLKDNVKTFLNYKKENIIKSNIHEDLLYGRVKVHWFPKFMKRVITKIPDYIKVSDIIIEVRNGIIPFVFDDLFALNIFDIHTNKPHIIVYTNSDKSSTKANEEWGNYYRRKLFWYDKNFNKNINKKYLNQMKKSAVIFLDAKNGKKEIIVLKKLINRLCYHIIEKKKKKGIHNYKVKCIFIGLPNVGKSALINRILEIKKAKSYDNPGLTTNIQMYSNKKYELIDTPGILAQNLYKIKEKNFNKNNIILDHIYNHNSNNHSLDNVVSIKNYNNYMHVENNIYLLALCNHISPKMYDVYNIAETLMQNIYDAYQYDNDYVDLQKIIKRYQINFNECLNSQGNFSPYHFIQKLARDKCHNDINQAAMRLVTDFRKNYLGRTTLNYPLYFNKKSITLKQYKHFQNQKSDKYIGW
ncbi:ribosome biogenesis GTPase A, putative [Plasmodium sp. gorilla clade G1]|nr:ribosome biogenesis GTPase A, putative [Plasmodium sp. gorilla clade G1]